MGYLPTLVHRKVWRYVLAMVGGVGSLVRFATVHVSKAFVQLLYKCVCHGVSQNKVPRNLWISQYLSPHFSFAPTGVRRGDLLSAFLTLCWKTNKYFALNMIKPLKLFMPDLWPWAIYFPPENTNRKVLFVDQKLSIFSSFKRHQTTVNHIHIDIIYIYSHPQS